MTIRDERTVGSDLCLSRSEIAELARAKLRKKQLSFLRTNGIPHYIDGHGWPVVTRLAIEGVRAPVQDKAWKPNKAA